MLQLILDGYSRWFIRNYLSIFVQEPCVLCPRENAPHPESNASEKISFLNVFNRIFLLEFGNVFRHHSKSSQKPGSIVINLLKLYLLDKNARFFAIPNLFKWLGHNLLLGILLQGNQSKLTNCTLWLIFKLFYQLHYSSFLFMRWFNVQESWVNCETQKLASRSCS